MALLRCMDYPVDVKVGYKLKFGDEFFTIVDIKTDGEKYTFEIQSDTNLHQYESIQWNDQFVEVYVQM